jgi:cell division topological specificity factor
MAWLKSMFASKPASGSVAKNRLQMVLRHDRGDLPPGLLEEIRDDIIEVLTKRLSLDRDNVVINLQHTARESRLVAEIPLLQTAPRRRR